MYAIVKRLLDIVVAMIAIVLLAPLICVIAAAIRLTMREHPLFMQIRAGRDGLPFTLLKFRTMTSERGSFGSLMPDGNRLTRLGQFLRKFSMDELPQLWNVLRGDMSLVGPRPLLMEYLPRYSERQRRRQEVKPGITGWAQVNGRNALSWERKFDLDIWYVDQRTIWLDFRILWLTLLKVTCHEGISQNGHATMPEFVGSSELEGN